MARTKAKITDALGRERKATRVAWGKVRQLPSGKHQASYVGLDGQRHTAPMTFSAKIDAESWLATQRAKIVAGEWVPAVVAKAHEKQREQARTLSEYAAEWVSTRTSRDGSPLRDTTRHEYERLLAAPLAGLASQPLAAITPERVRGWYAALVKTGRKTTAARAYGLLRAILQTAVVDGILPVNPAQIRGAQNASTGRKITPPTSAELAIIEAAMPENLQAMVAVAAWGALRFGEVTELRRKDVLLDGEIVILNIERAVTKTPGHEPVVGPPKSEAGVRAVALTPAVSTQLLRHIEKFAQTGADGLLFPGRDGGHFPKGSVYNHFNAARRAAGRADLPWHGLRHYGLTRYALAGATLAEIRERAGHSTVKAAMKYQHAVGRDAELAARMAELR